MNGKSFAYYRLPHAQEYSYISQPGCAKSLDGYAQLGSARGFVFAPFSIDNDCPLVVIEGCPQSAPCPHKEEGPTGQSVCDCPPCEGAGFREEQLSGRGSIGRYAIDFANFHSRLTAGEFTKIVLARRETLHTDLGCDEQTGKALFFQACERYPRMFIALVSTPQTGMWLMATPEPLLEQTAEGYHTVALAGTQHMGDGDWDEKQVAWNEKNIMEQRLVATYITKCLEQFSDQMSIEGPHTVRAGALAHLRTDFRFTLSDDSRMGELIAALHPTPAVCGLPKEATRRFILQNESAPRRYYSGFTGPLGIDGETHLYVTLRCMELCEGDCVLYAGGGLLPDSQLEQEWDETVAKMATMKNILIRNVQ